MSEIYNTLIIPFSVIGFITTGELLYRGASVCLYYLKHKRLPPHPAELERDFTTRSMNVEIDSLREENERLKRELGKANSDLEDIWKKTLNRI